MLRELLVRDWRLNRAGLLASIGIFTAFQIYSAFRTSSPRTFVVFACLWAPFLAIMPITREDRFHATGWSCTLPVTRRDLVRARFAGVWIFMASAIAVAVIVAAVAGTDNVPLSGVTDIDTLLVALALLTFASALLLPFTVRFGFMGVIFFLVAVQVLGAALLFFAVARTARDSGGQSAGGLKAGIAWVAAGLETMRGLAPPGLFYLAVAAALLLVNWAAYRVTLALFMRREF